MTEAAELNARIDLPEGIKPELLVGEEDVTAKAVTRREDAGVPRLHSEQLSQAVQA